MSTAGRNDGPVTTAPGTVTLWRPTGPVELALVEASGWREWPPRLPGTSPGLRCGGRSLTATRFTRRRPDHPGVQIPAEDLAALNANIVGTIELVEEFTRRSTTG